MLELDELKRALREQVVAEPLFLVALDWTGDGGGRTLRLVVDTDAGVTVEQLVDVSRRAGAWLDEDEERIPFKYRLDVCSPGLDRPIDHERLLRKAVGRPVKVEWREPGQPDARLVESRGRLLAVDEAELELETKAGRIRVPRAGTARIRHWLDG